LPAVERVYALEEADHACPSCGSELRPMKDQFEESELIDVIEARYELVRVKQQKYVCRCGGCAETALGPERATAAVQLMIRAQSGSGNRRRRPLGSRAMSSRRSRRVWSFMDHERSTRRSSGQDGVPRGLTELL
jgi:zinc-finger binding domain of transposase IS66